jgi:hypothetical protein
MTRPRTFLGLVLVLVAALPAVLAPAVATAAPTTPGARVAPAVATPSISVTPHDQLRGGEPVVVRATGLAPATAVRLVQCPFFDPEADPLDQPYCSDLATGTTDATGLLLTTVSVADPVYINEPFGDPRPVYCRADTCRMFVTWLDSAGVRQDVGSKPLHFTGLPATLAVTPNVALQDGQRVVVSGSAYGAQGRTLVIVEEACYTMVQGAGCYGTRVLATSRVGSRGGWWLKVPVHRSLADGTDCSDPDAITGVCQLTARILKPDGTPDDSFGVARLGQPGVQVDLVGNDGT